eukprot:TRINITY_DN121738_c0_g1_i1.p1 TRINITY_DN121738_c0_g1~~TRINITY_DN121738_c0_g1_i1.p1  ORF type:complete len:226 (-),score=32.03 TRINITY_DN121738_c0_g1_i1:72-707(-)
MTFSAPEMQKDSAHWQECRPRRTASRLLISAAMAASVTLFSVCFVGGWARHHRGGSPRTVRWAGSRVQDNADMIKQLQAIKQKKGFGVKPPQEAPEEPEAPEPVTTSIPSAKDAVREFMGRAQEHANPAEISGPQMYALIIEFFRRWKDRYGLGDVQLSEKDTQVLILMIEGNLNSIRAAAEFWPRFCAELTADRDQDVVELLVALTGLRK